MSELALILEKIEIEKGFISLKGEDLQLNFPEDFSNHLLIAEIKNNKKGLIDFLKNRYTIPLNNEDRFIATSGQKRLWLLSQTDEGSKAYHITRVFKTENKLNTTVLKESLGYLIERHEILRTGFYEYGGELYQRVVNLDSIKVDLKVYDGPIALEQEEELIKEQDNNLFILSEGSLLRFSLIKQKNYQILAITMHHIITDGWSFGIFINELVKVYFNKIKSGIIEFPALKIQFKDYALWHHKKNKNDNKSKVFWKEALKGDLPILDLISSKLRPAKKTYSGASISLEINKEKAKKWRAYFLSQESTLYTGLLSSFYSLLSRYTSQKEFIVGGVNTGRDHQLLSDQIGFYVNTIPLRLGIDKRDTFEKILKKTRKLTLGVLEHQTYSFDKILDCVDKSYRFDSSRNALFDCMFVLQNNDKIKLNDDLSFTPIKFNSTTIDFDFTFFLYESTSGKIDLEIEYNTDIYEEWFIKQLGKHYIRITDALITNPLEKIQDIEFLSKGDCDKLLYKFNDTKVDYPKEKTIVDLFREQVMMTPDNIAVVFEGVDLTYRVLDNISSELANFLLEKYPIKTESLIGVKLEQSEWLIVTILAILKSGCAYVPIDPNYPEERIKYIEKNSKCIVTIEKELLSVFQKEKKYNKSSKNIKITPSNLAYVIYTSGSTGKPKGVMIEHKSLVNLCSWHIKKFEVNTKSKSSLFSNISFDASIWEIFPYLCSGACLFPLTNALKFNLNELSLFFKKENISHAYLPTIIVSEFDFGNFSSNIKILTGGERLSKINNTGNCTIYNNYGPTENTIVTTNFKIQNFISKKPISIGKPIDNNQVLILDENLKLIPVGCIGELYVSGDSLARGYLNQKELTSKRFIKSPINGDKKMYRTGDLCKWLPNGEIEFFGREDNQVKIRGYRIELSEIEQSILQYSNSLTQVAVVVKKINNSKVLVAYLVFDEFIDKSLLRFYLESKLPRYMVPEFYISLTGLPLTANNKINVNALPEIRKEDRIKREYIPPRNQKEKEIVEIWESVLKVDNIGLNDNFFELGGNSLKALKIIMLLKQKMNYHIEIKDFFELQVFSEILLEIKKADKVLQSMIEEETNELSPIQHRLLELFKSNIEISIAYNLLFALKIDKDFNLNKYYEALNYVIQSHEILRTKFFQNKDINYQKSIPYSEFVFEKDEYLLDFDDTEEINKILKGVTKHKFDFYGDKGLIKSVVIKIGGQKAIVIFLIHHILIDFHSLEIIIRDISNFYFKNVKPKIPIIKYGNYVSTFKKMLAEKRLNLERSYWLKEFDKLPPSQSISAGKTINKIEEFDLKKDLITYKINGDNLLFVRELSKRKKTTVNILLTSCLVLIFSKLLDSRDIVFGTPAQTRMLPEFDNVVGNFLNSLAIRVQFEMNMSFAEFLTLVNNKMSRAYQNQNYPFNHWVNDIKTNKKINLYNTVIAFQNIDLVENECNLTSDYIRKVALPISIPRFDTLIMFQESKEEILFTIEYKKSKISRHVIESLSTSFISVVNDLINKHSMNVKEVLDEMRM